MDNEIITRQQYLANSKELHHAYWLQFATPGTYDLVRHFIGVDKIKASKDPAMNDIRLAHWDALNQFIKDTVNTKAKNISDGYTEPGKYLWSLSDCVCIAKAVAREIKKAE